MKLPPWIAGAVGPPALHALFATVRFRERGGDAAWAVRDAGTPLIFTLWHGHLLPLAYRYRWTKATALISEHRDGEYISRIVEGLGLGTARGSSTRGGSRGLRTLVQAARAGSDLAVTPDGPRGPARVVKEGVVTLAQLSGAALVPIAAACSRCWAVSSWDTFLVPKPFSRIHVALGEPILVGRHDDAGAALEGVQSALDEATRAAEAALRGEAGQAADASTNASTDASTEGATDGSAPEAAR